MGVLRRHKREKFAQALARLLAKGADRGSACVQAGIEAGYRFPQSRSFAPNCRKRAQRADVKARVQELLAPGIARSEREIEATVEWAIGKLRSIADYDGIVPKASEQISAIALIAKLKNWLAPERFEHSGPDGQPITTADVSDMERAKALADFIARTRATVRPAA